MLVSEFAFTEPLARFLLRVTINNKLRSLGTCQVKTPEALASIGVLHRLVWSKIDGTGLDGVYSIYQGHLFFQQATYACQAIEAKVTILERKTIGDDSQGSPYGEPTSFYHR